MSKIVHFLILVAIVSLCSIVYAKQDSIVFSRLESGALTVSNPFVSQLPKKEPVIIEMPEQPVEIKPLPTENREPAPQQEIVTPPPEPEVKERELPNVIVSGIIWNSDRPQAIINGKIVDIGDTIQEIQITNIRKSAVDGVFDGRTVTLKP